MEDTQDFVRQKKIGSRICCPVPGKNRLFNRVLGGIVAFAADNMHSASGGLELDFVEAAVSGELRRTISQQIITS